MKHTKLFSKLIATAEALIMLAACLAGCNALPQDNEGEYFTKNGQMVKNAFENNAVQINDFLYYKERYTYREEKSSGISMKRQAERIVRLSLKTGNVSSACVDPVCTHMYGSDCPLNVDYLYDNNARIRNLKAIGDWLFYIISSRYTVYDPTTQNEELIGTVEKYMIYNTVTGETRELFPRNSVGESGIAPAVCGGTVYGHMFFAALPEYVKDENGNESLVKVLRSYDVEKDKTTVIYSDSRSFGVPAVTNKRIYIVFSDESGNSWCSVDWNGKDMRREEGFYTPIVTYGPRAYLYDGEDNYRYISVYNIETHSAKELDIDTFTGGFCISGDVLYYSITSNVDEYASLDVNKLYEKYSDLDQAERTNAVIRDMNAVLYGGSSQIYSTDLDGGSRKLLFEYEHMVIQCVAAAGNYLYAYITSAQPPEYTVESTENEGFSRIDLTTGEITPVPLLGAE
ncbi:MAG TPA: hypothetical protein DEW22_05035 [Clostridiales bacterium]|nr:hypothetical protein [Clostridiales bacterium]